MISVEHSETFAYPAATVFAALIDLEARPAWQQDIVDMRVDPQGPARPRTRIYEMRKVAGYKSEQTLALTAVEQDRHLQIATLGDAKHRTSESHWIEPHPDGTCRLEIDGVPRIAQFFVRQTLTKLLPQYFERLKSVIASRTQKVG
jgi:hypothetical protein